MIPDPCTDEARADGCTCTVVGYEEVRRAKWCPLHGLDPDDARDKLLDEELCR